jgi:hypothetical protein
MPWRQAGGNGLPPGQGEAQRGLPASKMWPTRKRSSPRRIWKRLVGDELYQPVEAWELISMVQVHCGTDLTPTAVVKLATTHRRGTKVGTSVGTGRSMPSTRAINLVQVPNNLVEYLVQAMTEGHRRQRRCHHPHRSAGQPRLQANGPGPPAPPPLQRARRGHRHHRRQRQSLHAGAQQADRRRIGH